MYAADFVPVLKLISCALIGFGMVACQMVPLYGLVLMKSYPSRYLSPTIIGLALVAVLVQGGMVEAFRSAPSMLFLAYGVIMVILVILYLQIEPYFLYTLRRKIPEEVQLATTEPDTQEPPHEKKESAPAKETLSKDSLFAVLSKRELEVVDLIARGYTNAEIANVLVISVHTVNDHTKKIYRKLNVHSRLEVAALANRQTEPHAEH
ncbi:MAG: helix-turn-helix transcriptional regulator [Oscillospiraceae bacterium]|nr:helix-turn-helix transcriptional regulator [Oscillospiraceae bacterium]